MRLKKGITILWMSFAVVFLVTLVLLTKGERKDAESENYENSSNVLEVYAWYDEMETFRALAEGFTEKYPDIQVNVHYLPSSENIQGLQIAINGENVVDVIAIGTPAAAAQMIEKNQVMDLSGLLQGADLSGIQVLMESLQQETDIYMLPYRNSAWVVYYNTDIFDEENIPYPEGDWTWEEYADMAERLTDPKKGRYGSLNYESNWWRVPVRTVGAEDPMKEEDLEMFAEAAKWNYELTYERKAAISYNQLTSMGGKDYVGRFLSGEAAMMYCGEWCLPMMRERIESEYPDFSYDVAKLPHWESRESYEERQEVYEHIKESVNTNENINTNENAKEQTDTGTDADTGEKFYAIGSPAVLMVAKKSQKKEEAALFLKYASGEEGAKQIAAKGILPAWNSDEIRQIFQDSMQMPKHTEYFFPKEEISSFPATTDYTMSMNLLHDNIWSYLLGEVSLETALWNYKSQLAERMVSK